MQIASRGPANANPTVIVTDVKLTKSNNEVVTLGNNFCLTKAAGTDMYWFLGDIGFDMDTTTLEATVILCDPPAEYGDQEAAKVDIQFRRLSPV